MWQRVKCSDRTRQNRSSSARQMCFFFKEVLHKVSKISSVCPEGSRKQTVREMFQCSFTEECVHHTNLTFWTNHPSVAEAGWFLKAKFSAYAPVCCRQKHFNQSRNDWNALQWVSSRQNTVTSQKAVNGTKKKKIWCLTI